MSGSRRHSTGYDSPLSLLCITINSPVIWPQAFIWLASSDVFFLVCILSEKGQVSYCSFKYVIFSMTNVHQVIQTFTSGCFFPPLGYCSIERSHQKLENPFTSFDTPHLFCLLMYAYGCLGRNQLLHSSSNIFL